MTNIMESILYARKSSKILHLLPTFINHILSFEMLYNNHLLKISLRAILKHCSSNEDPHIQKQITNYACKIWAHFKVSKQFKSM
jgi:hypothetical protein